MAFERFIRGDNIGRYGKYIDGVFDGVRNEESR